MNGEDLEARLLALEQGEPPMDLKIASLEDQVSSLKSVSKGYTRIRHSFISRFNLDKLGNATDEDMAIIAQGSLRASGGDAIFDAKLYQGPGKRRDTSSYKQLYGLDPQRVSMIGKFTLHLGIFKNV
jgi:hypothetical protein